MQITKQGGQTATESPDGRYLYYAKYESSPTAIWRVPVSGGEEEPVVDGLSYRSTLWSRIVAFTSLR